MSKFLEQLKITLNNLARNKGRTFLSILGVTIGIATVLVIFSVGEAIRLLIVDQVSSFGSDYIQVEARDPLDNGATGNLAANVTTLTQDDAEAIFKSGVTRDYYTGMLAQKNANYKDYNKNVYIYGVSASYINIDPIQLQAGRFYTEEEEDALERVVVLGSGIASSMFGDEDPIGKRIKLGTSTYRVIGVFKSRGSILFFDQDSFVYVPTKTVQRLILGVNHISFIFNRVAPGVDQDAAAEEIRRILRERHDIDDPTKDDFNATTAQQAMDILGAVLGGVSVLLLLLASISLIVGGVGITNIMYVTVSERVPEIGLRKALGATRKGIQNQFLQESIIITLIGGVIGSLLGMLITLMVALIARQLNFEWPLVIKIEYFLIACGVAAVVGLIAGYRPAQKAAKLDPIVALRREE